MKHILKLLVMAMLAVETRAVLRLQDADAPAEGRASASIEKDRAKTEKDRVKGDKERTKTEKSRGDDHAYAKARKLVDKGQWEEALKALDDARNDTERADAAR